MSDAVGFVLFDTAIGPCGMAWGERGIVGCFLPESDEAITRRRMRQRFPGAPEGNAPGWVQALAERVVALLRGEAVALHDAPLDMSGVPELHRRVYEIALRIRPGDTLSYGDIARELGDLSLARAVGQALGRNPFAPIVPCHRVLAAGGKSGGFSARGGLALKLQLLTIEGARFGDAPGLFDAAPEAATA